MSNTIMLHRVIKTSPEKIFRAFSSPEALACWLPPYGFLCTVYHFEFRVCGSYNMSFFNFSTGSSHSFGGKYLEIIPDKLIKNTDVFDNPALQGEMITTAAFKKVSCGTELSINQEGIPEMIPPEMCYLGWQESLEKLIHLVEPEIPDA